MKKKSLYLLDLFHSGSSQSSDRVTVALGYYITADAYGTRLETYFSREGSLPTV